MVKITVLMENTASDARFAAEHGLSLWIETEKHNILFDSGASSAFADNGEKLGIDLSRADLAVLSHGHYDHGGGLSRFLELNEKAPVYVSSRAFTPCYGGNGTYIGLDPLLADSGRMVPVGDELTLDEELAIYSCNGCERPYYMDSFGLFKETEQGREPDDFLHEQYLLIRAGDRKILISGCSHKGVLNIAGWFRPDVLVGGFHFMGLDPEQTDDRAQLEFAADTLLAFPSVYYTGHCTGLAQYDFLKQRMGRRLQALQGGLSFVL